MKEFEIKAVYADGGVVGRNPSTEGGTWAYCHVNAASERIAEKGGYVWRYDEDDWTTPISNNFTEMLALAHGLMALPGGWHGTICSDSQITLGRLFWGWKWSKLPPWLVTHATTAIKRINVPQCTVVLLEGHPTKAQLLAGIGKRGGPVSEHNVWCDKECGRQAKECIDASIPF